MDWDFWRIAWPNAATVFVLAIVPLYAVFNQATGGTQQASIEVTGRSASLVLATPEVCFEAEAE